MKNLKFFLLFVTLLIILPGCQDKKTVPLDEPEILMGRDCGLDRLPCCKENPSCSFAQQCCPDPNDANRNYCADSCTCGGDKEFCCQDEPKCHDGLTCFQGSCQTCGKENEPCCQGAKCEGTLACNNNKCVPCGVPGNPCCEGSKCQNDTKLEQTKTDCNNGLCRLCGWGGEPACSGITKCVPGQLLNNEVCYQCGEYNQPCCQIGVDSSFDCNPKDTLKCELGFCTKK